MQGSFWVDWEVRGGKACGFALVWWMGCVWRVYAFCKCRLIPPHPSPAAPPFPSKGKASVRCANMANMALHCGLPLRSALTSRLRDKLPAVFFPPKGKPSLHCANMANIILCCGLPLRFALIRRLRRHLPPQRGRLPIVLLISKRVLQAFGTSDICI